MGGFLFGPLSALIMSIVVALLEMIAVSDSGHFGALMNASSSAAFTCTAAFIYSKNRNIQGAMLGLAVGCIVATATMLLLNYTIVPLYTLPPGATPEDIRNMREMVVGMMIPIFLPFNLIKTSLNAVLAILLYKRVSVALIAAGLHKETLAKNENRSPVMHHRIMIVSALIAVALITLMFVIRSGN
jgi:riboflavin transporter FmnP